MPSITGGDQLGEDYAPFLYKDGKYILLPFTPIPSKEEACKRFHGYTSNPQLCKGCNKPVGEHLEFMAAHKEKKEKKDVGEYEKKRNKLIELSGTEIDGPEEMIDLGGVSMPLSLYEKFRDRFVRNK